VKQDYIVSQCNLIRSNPENRERETADPLSLPSAFERLRCLYVCEWTDEFRSSKGITRERETENGGGERRPKRIFLVISVSRSPPMVDCLAYLSLDPSGRLSRKLVGVEARSMSPSLFPQLLPSFLPLFFPYSAPSLTLLLPLIGKLSGSFFFFRNDPFLKSQ